MTAPMHEAGCSCPECEEWYENETRDADEQGRRLMQLFRPLLPERHEYSNDCDCSRCRDERAFAEDESYL